MSRWQSFLVTDSLQSCGPQRPRNDPPHEEQMMQLTQRIAAVATTVAAAGGLALMAAPVASAAPGPPPPPGSYGKCHLTLTTTGGVLGGLEDLLYGGANNWQAYCPAK